MTPRRSTPRRSSALARVARLAWLGAVVALGACSADDGPAAGNTASTGVSGSGGISGTSSASTGGSAGAGGSSSVSSGGASNTGVAGNPGTTAGSGGTAGANAGGGGDAPDAAGDGVAPLDATGSLDGASRDASPRDASVAEAGGPFALTSTAFQEGQEVPLMYKCSMAPPAGQNISPPLSWTPGPATTKGYAMTLIHNAADMSIHWVLWDVPESVTSLAPDVEKVAEPTAPPGSKQVKPNLDGSTWFGYQGPCPQAAGARQNYLFAVYALDVATLPGVTTQSTTAAVMSAIRAHQVARATLQGTQIRQ